MRTPAELTERFRERHLKVTPQRQAIFRMLHGDPTHPTAEAVHAAVAADMPTISLRTVYQTLNDLVDMGEIHRIELGTRSARFDPNVEASHHHLVCDRCGLVRDVFADTDDLVPDAGVPHGFEISGTDVVFRGLCERCRDTSDHTINQPS
jgi:Fe2+ or Zn2+ uptake regulation protein